jgi:hypothetical protein
MEYDLKKIGRRPIKKKWKSNQSTKFNLIGCDTIVNSPKWMCLRCVTGYCLDTIINLKWYTIRIMHMYCIQIELA